jgi:hypothetical protein
VVQAVIRRPLTAEGRVLSLASLGGIRGKKVAIGHAFLQTLQFFLVRITPAMRRIRTFIHLRPTL